MEFTLKQVSLWSRFEGRIFSSEDVHLGKPAPDLFLHAASTLGYEPSDCIVVEDSPIGVQAALAAKMKVIAYSGGITAESKLVGEGVVVISHLNQLAEAVNSIVGN